MNKYVVSVEVTGKLIFFKNKKIRTPFVLELADSDVELFKTTMNSLGIEEYEIKEIKKTQDDYVREEVMIPEDKEVVIEDLYSDEEKEPSTILEQLLKDEKNGE